MVNPWTLKKYFSVFMWLPRMKAKPQVIIRPKGIGNFSSKINIVWVRIRSVYPWPIIFGFRPLDYHFIDKRQQQCFIIQKRDELNGGEPRGRLLNVAQMAETFKMEIFADTWLDTLHCSGVKKRSKTCTRTVSSEFCLWIYWRCNSVINSEP